MVVRLHIMEHKEFFNHLRMSRHVVGAFAGMLERNLLWYEPGRKEFFFANVAENKVCAVVGTTATARQTWEPAVCEVQCSSGKGTHTGEKTSSIHCITFPLPPMQRNIKARMPKRGACR